ncbi:related to Oligoribonuclease, mitochondrial [Saccharomycodes ludwigii]|uniref:Related to Oligoribonuclease, mitochondrial n=1 Tax=Saccharomycodes ludwigii TaxID=36035 RepID=A0A376B9T6_9ASCO|nr:hypothetical protein SCDLUD_000651 [Saccharomycodes ludwigii]KAH3903041.1 hypothetical protein SCDLUD_000651 [Saccharomycodes ludwigii]SSD61443.1 related to Oligoribonuclease, mitochondrial [Saccharomycodes ludwigii]
MSNTPDTNNNVFCKKLFKPIVWIDCEMTGLNHIDDHIIEICCIITDGNLNVVDPKGYESVIHYSKEILDNMNEWCVEHHGSSGLTEKVLTSDKTREQVEDELLSYIKSYIPDERKAVLAGNSIHMDRLFMLKEFPKVIEHLFYRLIDVSTIMEVCYRHNPELQYVAPRKVTAHTARSDILESIAQLKWYEEHYLKNRNEVEGYIEQRNKELGNNLTIKNNEKLLKDDTVGDSTADVVSSLKRKLQEEKDEHNENSNTVKSSKKV